MRHDLSAIFNFKYLKYNYFQPKESLLVLYYFPNFSMDFISDISALLEAVNFKEDWDSK